MLLSVSEMRDIERKLKLDIMELNASMVSVRIRRMSPLHRLISQQWIRDIDDVRSSVAVIFRRGSELQSKERSKSTSWNSILVSEIIKSPHEGPQVTYYTSFKDEVFLLYKEAGYPGISLATELCIKQPYQPGMVLPDLKENRALLNLPAKS